MKIPLVQITATPRHIDFSERFQDPDSEAVRFVSPVRVRVTHYRSGSDLFFEGILNAEAEGVCARCLEEYRFELEKKFDFVLIPGTLPTNKNRKLRRDEMDFSCYQGEEIDLSPFVYEQALLGFPLRTLCHDSCMGLCPECGVNRNITDCDCESSTGDLRMAVFRRLRVNR